MSRAPRLRPGITLTPRPAAAGGVIVSDREGRRHFLVATEDGRLVELLDGADTLAEIDARLAIAFPTAEIPPEMVAEFVGTLESLGLLEGALLPPRRRPMLSPSGLLFLQV